MLKAVMAGVFGFAMGVVVCRRMIEQEYEDLANDEIAAFKEAYLAKHEVDDRDYAEIVTETEMVVQAAEALTSYKVEPGHVNYQAYSSGWQETPAVQASVPVVEDDEGPIIITMEDFADNDFGHEQYNLKYYPECGTLTNEIGDTVITAENREQMVGDTLSVLNDPAPGEGIMYVRAPKLNMEYEIWREAGTYADSQVGDDE